LPNIASAGQLFKRYSGDLSRTTVFLSLFALLLASRLCHVAILWEGDSYPLAAAEQVIDGKALYRDVWFDKPPLLPLAYVLWGARPGWPLRVADALFAMLASWLAYRFARDLWSEREGLWAAALLGFFLVFDLPSAILPMASDLMIVAPHLAAVWLAWKRRPFWSGAMAGVAFWISPKGIFVGAVCALWDPPGALWMAAGFAAFSGVSFAMLAAFGALGPYWDEVWRWGRLYAGSTFVASPWREGVLRTANWVGFHAALVFAAACGRWKGSAALRWAGWLAISAAGVAAGLRFFPRYYLLLLVPMVLLASRGMVRIEGWRQIVAVLLLAIPVVRFAPSYRMALRDAGWRDTAMDRDSRSAAALVRSMARREDSLFVWGYRPELYVYTRLPAATIYLDSQPLTGVPADRHLTQSEPVESVEAAKRRASLVTTRPSFIVDGLGLYNPRLAIGNYTELREWLARYREIGRTGGCVVYQRW